MLKQTTPTKTKKEWENDDVPCDASGWPTLFGRIANKRNHIDFGFEAAATDASMKSCSSAHTLFYDEDGMPKLTDNNDEDDIGLLVTAKASMENKK